MGKFQRVQRYMTLAQNNRLIKFRWVSMMQARKEYKNKIEILSVLRFKKTTSKPNKSIHPNFNRQMCHFYLPIQLIGRIKIWSKANRFRNYGGNYNRIQHMDVSSRWRFINFKTMTMEYLHLKALAGSKLYLCQTPHNLYKLSTIRVVLTLTHFKSNLFKTHTLTSTSPTLRQTSNLIVSSQICRILTSNLSK